MQLAARGDLTVARLHMLARRTPHSIPVYLASRDHEPETPGERKAAPLITEFIWEVVQDLDETGLRLADSYHHSELRGARFVRKACEHVETRGLTAVTAEGYEKLPTALRWLADAHLEAGETIEGLASDLSLFRAGTLRALLPHAPGTEEAFLRALGWEAALPLLRLTRRIAARQHETTYGEEPDAPNSSDPESGVVDRREIVAALERAGPALAKELMAALRAGRIKVDNTTKLIEAVGGWNRKQIEKGLAHLGQINLKALGLLPLERTEEEVVERYRRLRQAARDCRTFGPERQTHTRAAVAAGLANLAQTAGYDDVGRMEWAVEARIADAAADPRALVGEYEVAVEMPELEPRVVVQRAGRMLATVPPAVRKAKEFAALREKVTDLKAQVARFRRSLEEMMTEGRPFAAADLSQASKLPALDKLLRRLVLKHPDGSYGLFGEDGVRDVDGRHLPLVDGIQVAHAVQLIADSSLRAWQRAIVAKRIVQPFKQVFREVYVLTDAERAADATLRFAGHKVDERVLRRLLQSRGWEVEAGDAPLPFRRYRAAGLRAWFDFPEARHFLGGDEPVASGAITFTEEASSGRWEANVPVPLARVPPVIVCEALRDADLMVSVARAGDDSFSAESYASRGDAVVALAELLGVPGVERDGRFVRVSGKLASYRIHLGSGTVHVEPANAVCILPEPKRKKTEGIWLPFAEDDERLAEVVSKVVLLAADHAIKDRAILAQIQAAAGVS